MKDSSIPEKLSALQPFWTAWYIDSLIGAGTYGKVYKIVRHEMGETYFAALKWIPLPSDDQDLNRLRESGIKGCGLETYYEGMVKELQREIKILHSLRGTSHIVSYEDHLIDKRKDEIGWDIFIRMELLMSLGDYLAANKITCRDVIRVGIDLTDALILCQKHNIIHRDIKPANIFISPNGDFKLGDFGIARKLDIDAKSSVTRGIGTLEYMAPEVFLGNEYGTDVDLYSLGLVMYKLLNNMHEPFIAHDQQLITPEIQQQARNKRYRGVEELPRPKFGGDRLWEIIKRTCAFRPSDRYSSPLQMKEDLQAILYDANMADVIYANGEEVQLLNNRSTSTDPAYGLQPGSKPGETAKPLYDPNVDDGMTKPLIPANANPAYGTDGSEERIPYRDPHKDIFDKAFGVTKSETTKPLYENSVKSNNTNTKNKKKAFWATTCIVCVLLAATAAFLLFRHVSLGNLSVRDTGIQSLILAWDDSNKGPWHLTAVPSDLTISVVDELSDSKVFEINNLIPGITYEITVENTAMSEIATISATTDYAPVSSNVDLQLKASSLCYYYHADISPSQSLADLITNYQFRQIENDLISLTEKPVVSQTYGYLYMIYFTNSQSQIDTPFSIQLVFRFAESGAFAITRNYSRAASIDTSISIDELLDLVWNEYHTWPQDDLTMELYVDQTLLEERPIVFSVTNE